MTYYTIEKILKGEYMDDKITKKLQKIVQVRNTPVVVEKRQFYYKRPRSTTRQITSSEAYFYNLIDE